MTQPYSDDIRDRALKLGRGDKELADRLLVLIYDELHSVAAHFLRDEREGHTLSATALVHEAYLRLVQGTGIYLENENHFTCIAAGVMRRVLVDHARRKRAAKRGGSGQRIPMTDGFAAPEGEEAIDLLALDQALSKLAELDRRKSSVVELRYFAGLSNPEIAETLDSSLRTVERDWTLAKAWLYREMHPESGDEVS